MPELPEVETVRRGLSTLLGREAVIVSAEVRTRRLRAPVPRGLAAALAGARVQAIDRRAKYLIWRLDRHDLVVHLGMTGSWRRLEGAPGRHDHLLLHLADGLTLAFRDPRRFGLLLLAPPGGAESLPALVGLGPEPLGRAFTPEALAQACAGRRAPIKVLLLDQSVVAGIGNIYAAEACFRAGIDPRAPAGSLRPARFARLVEAVRAVLREAIAAGGSTISDHRQADGAIGRFQERFAVYGRAGAPCPACGSRLRGMTLGGRATVWCGRCQTRW